MQLAFPDLAVHIRALKQLAPLTLGAAIFGLLVLTGGHTQAQAQSLAQDDEPLSAIDWLSQSVEQPETLMATTDGQTRGTQATRQPPADEAPVSSSATTPSVSVQSLASPPRGPLGILPDTLTGLPVGLWRDSEAETLAALMQAERIDTLPALSELLIMLVLAQADAPLEGAHTGSFFLARIDKLLDFGALESAQAMLEAAGPDTPETFRRWFDVTLLTGTENAACRALRDTPDVAPTPAARVFCLARTGDWSAAALTLNTAAVLGDIDADMADLLARFLDPELFEDAPRLALPARISPLVFRMSEAIGEPVNTRNLPRAFSHADLRANVGWKAQLEAAERLARVGAMDDNALIGAYTSRVPAASGGVWERAKAVRALEAALADPTPEGIAQAVDRLWLEAQGAGLLVPVARVYGPALLEAEVPAATRATLFRLLLLSTQYEDAALNETLAATDPFLAAVARGDPAGVPANRPRYAHVRDAFAAAPDAALVAMAEEGRTGEALLRTIATFEQGLAGDTVALGEGLATLRALGLEDVARRTALQYLLLSR